MGGGVRPPEYFKTLRGRALAVTNLLTDEETAIKELVHEMGLEEHFSFLPFTAETGEIYSALDVVTFPNQGVGLGRPVLEAAMYGKPVVASGSGDGAGRAAAGRDRDPARRREPGRARGRAADADRGRRSCGRGSARPPSAHAREKFDPARNARAVESVYEQLLSLPARTDDTALAPAAA